MITGSRIHHLMVLFIFYLHFSCTEEIIPEVFKPNNEHDAYEYNLNKAGLGETALVSDWKRASQFSLTNPQKVSPPYKELFYLSSAEPEALGYFFSAKKGQKIQIDLDRENSDSIKLFLDLFRYDSLQMAEEYEHIASADKDEYLIGFEPRQDGQYILRVQPELLRGGSFNLEITVVPALRFPVADRNKTAIGSFFGDPRDGGRRKHHGIDIFASRHTPVLAPTDGYIRFVGERGLGGRVVWMRDHQRDMTLYFAHLHTLLAQDNTWVQEGDTLGTVGNTGNARTTAPHLHFGIYQDGPIDPYYFVADQPFVLKKIRGDATLLGEKIRTKRKSKMKSDWSRSGDEIATLEKYQLLEAFAATDRYYRVRLPDGRTGLVPVDDTESIDNPLSPGRLPDNPVLFEKPGKSMTRIMQLDTTEELKVLARDTAHWFVMTKEGANGWIEAMP